jgi:hypothetical protein
MKRKLGNVKNARELAAATAAAMRRRGASVKNISDYFRVSESHARDLAEHGQRATDSARR